MFIIEFIGTFVYIYNKYNKQIESKYAVLYISSSPFIYILSKYHIAYKTLIKTPHSRSSLNLTF